MTEILERRWKCDWCGVVSPVCKPTYGVFVEAPRGWVHQALNHYPGEYHFCCAYHEILWKNKRAASAETPEEAKT